MKKITLLSLCVLLFAFTQAQMTATELNQIDELNLMRTQPKAYAEILRKHAQNKVLDTTSIWILHNELIPLFDTMKPLNPLIPSDELRKAANQFNGYDTVSGAIWHDLDYYSLVSNKGGGQNISVGLRTNPRSQIISLMIDVCISDRGHRFTFLNRDYTHASVRIIKIWGKEGYLIGSAYGYVYDLISKRNTPILAQHNFKGVIAPGCGPTKPIKQDIEEWKNRK
jgi:hypothetical protein